MTFDFIPFPLTSFSVSLHPVALTDLPKRNAADATKVNTLEKREAAASKGAAILDLVQRYREKVPFSDFRRWWCWSVGGGCVFGRAALFWKIYPFFWGRGEFRLVAGEKKW